MNTITIVAAVQKKDNGIGLGPKLLTVIKNDQERGKVITMGGSLIMGRTTFETMPSPLPGRKNIVMTRDRGYSYDHPDVIVTHSLDEALAEAEKVSDKTFIFGGGQVYKEIMERDLADRLEITVIETDKEADIFFPDWKDFGETVFEESHVTQKGTPYTFMTINRRRVP